MKLRKGDKIRIKMTSEAAEIVEIIDEFHALVETFDGEVKIHAKEIEPFQAGDVKKVFDEEIVFLQSKPKGKKEDHQESLFSLNSRKNRFQYELDLHAEQLIGDVSTKSNEEILSIQLNRVKSYLQEALELRIQRIYLIHGIGSGRLKSEIESLLRKTKEITNFNNHYHPKYGKGATEVILR